MKTRGSLLIRLKDPADHQAWTQFFESYRPLILAFCKGRGLSDQDAEDVLQEVCRAVAPAMARFEYDVRRSTFRNWLLTVVRSKLYTFLSKNARIPRPAGLSTVERLAEESEMPEESESGPMEERMGGLRRAMVAIQPEFKAATWEAFRRTALLGESPEAVALSLGFSLNAVYIARSRVTARLRERMDATPIEFGANA